MIEFKNFPPQVSGDAIWSERGKQTIDSLVEAYNSNSSDRERVESLTAVITDTVMNVVVDNVPDRDLPSALGVINGLLQTMNVPPRMAQEMTMTAYAALPREVISQGDVL
ncbi:MAG TPA: hypothetical protein VF401_04515 [Candidatus Saccharimonadales bacterium]